ncbi:hypothetical protein TIFTF001_030286 [Ficus carica]|uniref:Anthocyanin acyltransferase n=1 Tax=Ficus carica TaxID=3494 RepID=A0AA88J2L6_FICCA|nr:hypothetical protein TIFTF001_030286 [Ficus carica]
MAHIPNPEEVKVIEQSKVSPPPGSVSTTSLPLTFFDVPWLLCCQIERLYFYEFPHPTHHFLQTLLPTLKHYLCLTLRHFFPYAANLVFPPPPEKPHIHFTDGDFVSLTVAESAADFDFLSANHPRPVRALHPFVPKSASTHVKGETLVLGPLLALQVTVFPNSGICIGVRFNHVAADGRAFHHFMKSWALVGRSGGDLTRLERELGLPSHDRTAVKDPNGLDWVLLYTWRSLESTNSSDQDRVPTDQSNVVVVNEDDDNVRATFVLRQAQIERLKSWAKNHFANDNDNNSTPFHRSLFVVTCALVWVCLAKSEETTERNPTAINKLDIDDEITTLSSQRIVEVESNSNCQRPTLGIA